MVSGMSKVVSFTAVYESVENGWYQGRLLEVPGVITAAPTRTEAEDLLLDALREYLLSLAEEPTKSDDADRLGRSTVNVEIYARPA
jgi:predicted RNase H-like HicB family nuclease